MTSLDPERLHGLCAELWPAAEAEPLGPWLLRADPSTTKRANSLNAFAPPEAAPEAALAQARAWFSARGRRPLAQIPADGGAIAPWLDAPFGETCVMVLALPQPLAPPAETRVERDEEPPEIWALIESHGAEDAPARLAVMRRTPPERRRFVTLEADGRAAAVAWVGRAADLALIAAVSVRSEARGRGLGRALMAGALETAAELGAGFAAVQVETENSAARKLYAHLGFREAYRYAYAEIRG